MACHGWFCVQLCVCACYLVAAVSVWLNVIKKLRSGKNKSSTSRVMAIPYNDLGFFFHTPLLLNAHFHVCCKPSFFKVQVNLSWWLAVWSQEVASVRGVGGLWRVVCGSRRGGIRHQSGKGHKNAEVNTKSRSLWHTYIDATHRFRGTL